MFRGDEGWGCYQRVQSRENQSQRPSCSTPLYDVCDDGTFWLTAYIQQQQKKSKKRTNTCKWVGNVFQGVRVAHKLYTEENKLIKIYVIRMFVHTNTHMYTSGRVFLFCPSFSTSFLWRSCCDATYSSYSTRICIKLLINRAPFHNLDISKVFFSQRKPKMVH